MQNKKSVRCDRKRMVLQEVKGILIRTTGSGSDLQESGSYPESSCFGTTAFDHPPEQRWALRQLPKVSPARSGDWYHAALLLGGRFR